MYCVCMYVYFFHYLLLISLALRFSLFIEVVLAAAVSNDLACLNKVDIVFCFFCFYDFFVCS